MAQFPMLVSLPLPTQAELCHVLLLTFCAFSILEPVFGADFQEGRVLAYFYFGVFDLCVSFAAKIESRQGFQVQPHPVQGAFAALRLSFVPAGLNEPPPWLVHSLLLFSLAQPQDTRNKTLQIRFRFSLTPKIVTCSQLTQLPIGSGVTPLDESPPTLGGSNPCLSYYIANTGAKNATNVLKGPISLDHGPGTAPPPPPNPPTSQGEKVAEFP